MSSIEGLLRSQSNELFKALQKAGFDKREFKWDKTTSNINQLTTIPMLVHVDTGCYFTFDNVESADGYRKPVSYSPGMDYEHEINKAKDWSGVMAIFNKWVEKLKQEAKEPDLWNAEDKKDFERDWLESNAPFDVQEIEEIKAGLDRVEQFLIERSVKTDEVLQEIQENINHLKKSAEKSGRRDWMMLFVGTITTRLADWAIETVHWHQLVGVLIQSAKKILPS